MTLLSNYVPDTFQKLVNDLLEEENVYQPEERRVYVPKADILERDAEFEIQLVMPGFKKENIELHIDDGVLTVSTVVEEKEETEDNEAKEHVVYHMRERIYGPYKRSFHLPENIKEDKIKATYENGILVIKLQKDKARPLKKTIKVN